MTPKFFFTVCFFILVSGTLSLANAKQDAITMNVPENVIKTVVSKTLPLTFKLQSDTMVGAISIDKINNLQFLQDKLTAHVTLSGHKLNLVTSIGGHKLRMKIGSLTMSFQCDATVRFDAPTQTLFLRPVITNLESSNSNKADVASAIVLLFNNQEFPLQLEDIKPIVADTGNKLLNIAMAITKISVQPDNLLLSLTPTVSATQK